MADSSATPTKRAAPKPAAAKRTARKPAGRKASAKSSGAEAGVAKAADDALSRGDEASLASLRALAENRVAIENVQPTVDGGQFPAKVVAGRAVTVEADVFCDGHDKIAAAVLVRPAGHADGQEGGGWSEAPLAFHDNDRWRGRVTFEANAPHEMQIIAWRDLWADWIYEVTKKHEAGIPLALELEEGARLVETAAENSERLEKGDKPALAKLAKALRVKDHEAAYEAGTDPDATALMTRVGLRTNLSRSPVYPVWADRERAAFSAWYELFPRSMKHDGKTHGTFDDVIERLPYVADLGFDVLYFPPIHPIGTTNRKGRNNSLTPEAGDVGVPYAIGSAEGGHMAVHPELGTLEDFDRLVAEADRHGLEIALDIALNASPDHPWIAEHPEWFDWRPDGTIRYAENPPKKYEDIVNFHFYRDALPDIWLAMRDMFLFWVEHGCKIFRVDNPHTKPLPFWQWLIGEVQGRHPDTIFLAEAFTKPKVMRRLAKVGFNQSYSYFTWRNTKGEIEEYLEQLTGQRPDTGGLGGVDLPHIYRPNFFVNTPDINPHYLQEGGRPAHRIRCVLAATLAGNWGMYNGFEICDARPIPGKEEYLDSEKYQLRAWDMEHGPNGEAHIKDDIRLVNRLRREHPALRQFTGLRFYKATNDQVSVYGKFTPDMDSFVLVAVSLDPFNDQSARFEVPLWEFGLDNDATIEASDLVTGEDFSWTGIHQQVWLTAHDRPYAIWQLHAPGRARRVEEPEIVEQEIVEQAREAEAQQMDVEGGRA